MDRAFELLEAMADAGGIATLSELAKSTGLPMPTIHRIVQSLVAGGYVRKDVSHRYALGPRLIRLGEVAGLTLGARATPYLRRLAEQIGETANLAMLEGDSVVYVAQAPSPHAMRMFTEVGRHVLPHCTGVGKALLAELPVQNVIELIGRTGLPARTEHTLTDLDALLAELRRIREQGFAVDDGEQEVGVRCVAVAVTTGPARLAVSVSGPSGRLTLGRVHEIAPVLRDVADRLLLDLGEAGTDPAEGRRPDGLAQHRQRGRG
ncbi:IclR family transcriptional regulator [Intrasporangium calvum]|nr:IclR family transcriptional regulator [Intrasporangium calvum]